MKSNIEEIGSELWKDPSEKNWEKLSKALKKDGVGYYKPVFGKGKLKNTQDLKNSYVELYGKDGTFITKIPIFKNDGKNLRGATIYLKGLQIKNG